MATYWALPKFSQEQEYAMGFPTIRDQFVYPTIIHYPLFHYPLFVTRHKLVPSLCIPATAARTWEEKGFVGTWSDGGKGGRVTFQNGGGVSLPSRITKRHSDSVEFSLLRQVSLAKGNVLSAYCIYGYIQLGLVLIKDIFKRSSLFCNIHTILFVKPIAL